MPTKIQLRTDHIYRNITILGSGDGSLDLDPDPNPVARRESITQIGLRDGRSCCAPLLSPWSSCYSVLV